MWKVVIARSLAFLSPNSWLTHLPSLTRNECWSTRVLPYGIRCSPCTSLDAFISSSVSSRVWKIIPQINWRPSTIPVTSRAWTRRSKAQNPASMRACLIHFQLMPPPMPAISRVSAELTESHCSTTRRTTRVGSSETKSQASSPSRESFSQRTVPISLMMSQALGPIHLIASMTVLPALLSHSTAQLPTCLALFHTQSAAAETAPATVVAALETAPATAVAAVLMPDPTADAACFIPPQRLPKKPRWTVCLRAGVSSRGGVRVWPLRGGASVGYEDCRGVVTAVRPGPSARAGASARAPAPAWRSRPTAAFPICRWSART